MFFNVQNVSGNRIAFDIISEFKNNIIDIIFWIKKNPVNAGYNKGMLSNGYEYIFCLTDTITGRNFKRYNFQSTNYLKNYIIGNVNSSNKYSNIHNALMPLWLAEYIIRYFSKENDIIYDPFGGLFTTAIACIRNNRRYICTEKEEIYYKKGIERIEYEKALLNNEFYIPDDHNLLFKDYK